MKEELFWLREWENERELTQELDKWVEYYNDSYLHFALGYKSLSRKEAEFYSKEKQQNNILTLIFWL